MTTRIHKTFLAAIFFLASLGVFASGPYTIPVVVHIIHENGPENISDSLVIATITRINQNYGMTNAGLAGVSPVFAGVVGNMQIEFCLAHTDTQGAVTTGIEHIQDSMTYHGDSVAAMIDQWTPTKYLNIWVVDTLRGDYYFGKATSPSQAAINPTTDGVVVSYRLFTEDRDGLISNHIGHYLNLENTWGNTNDAEIACGDDAIADTPPTKGNYSSCDTTFSLCNIPARENIQNFMNYTPCVCMFTQGQVQRVHEALDTTIAGRNNLYSAANLAVTCSSPNGIKNINANSIIATPNPFTNEITISGLESGEQTLAVYDVTGRLMIKEQNHVAQNSVTLNLSAVAAGAYILSITHDGATKTTKIIKEK